MFRVVENWVLFYLTMTYIGKCNIILNTDSGTATKFWLGGGADSGPSNPPTPNSDFSSNFGHFILKVLKDLETLVSSLRQICKYRDFWGDVPLPLSDGGMRPPPRCRRPWILSSNGWWRTLDEAIHDNQMRVAPISGSRKLHNILKNPTTGMPDSSDVISYMACHWSDFSGHCIISWNLNLVKPDSGTNVTQMTSGK